MLEHWLWLAHRSSVSDRLKNALLQHFGSPEAVFEAEESAFDEIERMTPEAKEALGDKNLDLCREIIAECAEKTIGIVTCEDSQYPSRLKNIYDPPLVLYYKGTLPDFDSLPAIGIVGTRKPSAYGSSVARRLGTEISRCGGLVVSGMAAGVDGAAMTGALVAGYAAVGVLGCGVDVVYPRSNRELYDTAVQYGCLLSEFMPGSAPYKWNFPRRNRIISGLSCGVVVVEAPEKSGSLITAHCALEQGRDVFAVPGNIDLPGFTGSNRLLREGAGAISCGWDVLSEYQARFPDKIRKDDSSQPEQRTISEQTSAAKVAQKASVPRKKAAAKPASGQKDIDKAVNTPYIDLKNTLQGLSAAEQAIVAAIGAEERLVDDVVAETGLSTARILGALTLLEIKGIVKRHPGKRISLKAGKQ